MFPVGSATCDWGGAEGNASHPGAQMIQCTPYECEPEPDICKHGKAGAYCDLENKSSEKYVCKSCEGILNPSDCDNTTAHASNSYCLHDCFNMAYCNHAFTDCYCVEGYRSMYPTLTSPGHEVFKCVSTQTTTPTTTTTTTTTTPTTTTTTLTTTQVKLEWCNLDNYHVQGQERLNSSKNIIVLGEINDKTYDKAQMVCKDICGDLYFPSSQKENDEVESVLDGRRGYSHDIGWVWLRIHYDQSDGKWKDPDNKENLTFTNFEDRWVWEDKHEDHAVMSSWGKWLVRKESCDFNNYADRIHPQSFWDYVLCEQS